VNLYLDGMFYRCSGVGRVMENLLDAFLESGDIREIHTVIPACRKTAFLEQFPSAKVHPLFVDYGPMGVGDLFRKSAVLRSLAGTVSLYFFPGHNVPLLMPGRYVVSVNDITVFSPYFEMSSIRKTGFRRLLGRAMRGAETVVTISGTVKDDLVREFGLPREKIRVIHPWVKDSFFEPPGGECIVPPVGGDYILYLGLRIAHKNLDGLVRAFLPLAAEFPGLRLAVAGSRYRKPDMIDRWKDDPRLKGKIVEFPDPTDEDIRRLFAGAKAFVFPSFAEGFGLPPLEAMASGVPVVCSDIPVFREVYGEAVHFVDPHRPESIAEGIRRVLTDADHAAGLARKGRDRAGIYRKDRCIAEYLKLLR
jgi:alpha-1,3-rhamnosyl/mannosyltransferase